MATTWDAVRGKVRGDLWRPGSAGVPDEVCDRAIHAALLEIESERRWLYLEAVRRPVAVTAAADEVSLPADIVTLESVSLVRTTGYIEDPLELQSITRVRAMRAQASISQRPSAYARAADLLYFDGELQVGETVELVGKVRTPDDVAAAIAGADTNQTLQLHEAAVISFACADVCRTYLKNEAEESRQQRAYDLKLERMQREDDEKRSDMFGGLIQPDTTYHDMAGGFTANGC